MAAASRRRTVAFEALDRALIDLVRLQHLHGSGPPQHRMAGHIDDAHPAGTQFAFELVLTNLLSFNRRLLGFSA